MGILRLNKVMVLSLVCFYFSAFAFSQARGATGQPRTGTAYKIGEVEYVITGRTADSALSREIQVDKERIFETREDFDKYIEFLRQEFHNLRQLEEVSIETDFGQADEERIIRVNLTVTATDTHNFIILPYPKYDSNSGFVFKLRGKDYNFLGLLKTFSFDLSYEMQGEDTSSDYNHVVGLSADYSRPFKLAVFDASWDNAIGFNYMFGENKFGIKYETGLNLSKPFFGGFLSVNFGIGQGVAYGLDAYERDTDDYPDDDPLLTFKETAKVSTPMRIATILNFVNIYFTPDVHFEIKWTPYGHENPAFGDPIIGMGYSFSGGQVNEVGTNFRKGVYASLGQNIDYNISDDVFTTKIVDFNVRAYAAGAYESISARLNYFKFLHAGDGRFGGTGSFGGSLRGVRDSQRGVDDVNGAIVLNVDVPIKVFQTDWVAHRFPKFFRYLDFEVQAAPFIDMAFIENPHTGRNYAFKDAWVAGGLEVLVYPSRWRSVMFRVSAGIDLSQFLGSKLFDQSWREGKSKYEIFFGIGKLY